MRLGYSYFVFLKITFAALIYWSQIRYASSTFEFEKTLIFNIHEFRMHFNSRSLLYLFSNLTMLLFLVFAACKMIQRMKE